MPRALGHPPASVFHTKSIKFKATTNKSAAEAVKSSANLNRAHFKMASPQVVCNMAVLKAPILVSGVRHQSNS